MGETFLGRADRAAEYGLDLFQSPSHGGDLLRCLCWTVFVGRVSCFSPLHMGETFLGDFARELVAGVSARFSPLHMGETFLGPAKGRSVSLAA